jgi:hypothetical protein
VPAAVRIHTVRDRRRAQMVEETYAELHNEYAGKLLPPSHPVARHVARVVERILSANGLGTLALASPSARAPERVFGGGAEAEGGWGEEERGAPGTGGRAWRLLVVNDRETVNAAASFGNIIVFTGILPVAKDEDGLASVLSHGTPAVPPATARAHTPAPARPTPRG